MYKTQNCFLNLFVQRLKDQYLQEWSSIVSDLSNLCYFFGYKLAFEHETYLNCLQIVGSTQHCPNLFSEIFSIERKNYFFLKPSYHFFQHKV